MLDWKLFIKGTKADPEPKKVSFINNPLCD
jgi:hypothetical protein